jgi:hypothetical protein
LTGKKIVTNFANEILSIYRVRKELHIPLKLFDVCVLVYDTVYHRENVGFNCMIYIHMQMLQRQIIGKEPFRGVHAEMKSVSMKRLQRKADV